MLNQTAISGLIILLIFAGCSSSARQTVLPDDVSAPSFISEVMGEGNYGLLFDGSMVINPVDNSVDIIERTIARNYNITGFIQSACNGGCFRYAILSYIDDVLTLKLEIENPTTLQVYDVRMIFTGMHGKKVLNPDNFIGLFDPPGGMPFNPQIAFRKESDNRDFPIGPGAIDDEILELWFPSGANPLVDFVIAASYPGQCSEPFQIYDKAVDGELTPSGGTVELSARVKDHQSNVSWVAADTHIFTGGYKFFQYDSIEDKWSASISNDLGVSEGIYTIYFAAGSPYSDGVNLYDSFQVTVSSGSLSFETPRPIDDYSYPANPDTITQGGKGIKVDDDYVYIIYYITDEIGNQQIDLMRSSNGGDSFLPHVRINTDDPNSIHICPAIDVSPDGTVHAVWTRGDLSGFGSNSEYAKSTNHGETFTTDMYLGGFFFELWCDISVYGNDKVFALRNGAPYGLFNLFFDRSLDGGNNWDDDENLSHLMWGGSVPFNDLFPVMDIDPVGNIYVIFESDASPEKQDVYNMWITRSTDFGSSFSLPKTVNDLQGRMRLPNVACDSKGGVHAFWVYLDSGTEGDIRHSYSDDGGISFKPSVEVDDVDFSANEPVVAIDPNSDMLYVAYVADNIRLNRSSDGINWGESIDLGMSGTGPNIFVDRNSRVHLEWANAGRIYYTRSLK